MSLKSIDLTTALRPSLLPDEVLLAVQDNVGLYQGKSKIEDYQVGQVYLTSHRICYVGHEHERDHAVGIDLKEVESSEFYAGFLKSSPKITLIPKPPSKQSWQHQRNISASTTSASPARFTVPPNIAKDATWVCPICTFSNPVPSNFDPISANEFTPLAPCLACGIKPPLTLILKAAIASATNRTPGIGHSSVSRNVGGTVDGTPTSASGQNGDIAQIPGRRAATNAGIHCPRCTFLNHASLTSCEICGANLTSGDSSMKASQTIPGRTESPGPTISDPKLGKQGLEHIKLSFRARDDGAKIFNERLKGALTQRKWLLQNARPVPKPGQYATGSSDQPNSTPPPVKNVGIAGLEQRRIDVSQNNAVVIGNAFEDLEALMTSAKEIVALAESFARQTNTSLNPSSSSENALLAQSASALGLVTTKDMLSNSGTSDSLYLSELARNLAEFLTDDAQGILKRAGGIMTLVDLWAIFNRARGGVELISPRDFEKAARLWEKLRLPVRLRTFKSGVLVVQSSDRTDEKTIKAILDWLSDLHHFPPERDDQACNWRVFGKGVTVRDAAVRFGWSLGVATEELEVAEESGALCREEGIEGLKYWENWIGCVDPGKMDKEADLVAKNLKTQLGFE